MSSLPAPWFHTQSLRQRFRLHLDNALSAGRIDADEQRWLERLDEPHDLEHDADDLPAVKQLLLEDGLPVPLGLASALLIVRSRAEGPILYLDTLSHGLERFVDRKQLGLRLRQLFSPHPDLNPVFEQQSLEGPVFERRMLLIVDHQAQALTGLAGEFNQIPSLHEVIGRVLKDPLKNIWPVLSTDLQAPLVQIVDQDLKPDGEAVIQVLSVEEAAFAELTGQVLPAGVRRRLLGARGQTLDAASETAFSQALARLGELESTYLEQIDAFWRAAGHADLSRTEYVELALADGFVSHLWQFEQTGQISHETQTLLARLPRNESGSLPISRLSLFAGGQGPFKLVSLYLIELPQNAVLLYSPLKGLRYLESLLALDDYLASEQGRREWVGYLSLDDQAAFVHSMPINVQRQEVSHSLFFDCVEAVIGLQKRNLREALKHRASDGFALLALMDDALDIRGLIDGRLPGIDSHGRWRPDHTASSATWPGVNESIKTLQKNLGPAWLERLNRLDELRYGLTLQQPGLESLASQALAPYMTLLGDQTLFDAQHVYVRLCATSISGQDATAIDEATPGPLLNLTSLLLERLTGQRNLSVPASCQVFRRLAGSSQMVSAPSVTPVLINHMLDRVVPGFAAFCTASVSAFYNRALHLPQSQVITGRVLGLIRESLLATELGMAQRLATVDQHAIEMLQQVLGRPERDLRLACGEAMTEVYTLNLKLDNPSGTFALSNALVLQRPAHADQGLVFWSILTGLQPMKSLAALSTRLMQSLKRADLRGPWLALFGLADRVRLEQHLREDNGQLLSLSLDRVDGHFIRLMQRNDQQYQQQLMEQALAEGQKNQLDARLFKRYVDLSREDDRLSIWLDSLTIRAQNLILDLVLPAWLGTASLSDLEQYTGLLKDYALNSDPAEYYLADIPPLPAFASEQLQQALQQDFPGQTLDPARIKVTLTRYIATPVPLGNIPSGIAAATVVNSESLIDYALNHFSKIQDATLSLKRDDDAPLPEGLTPTYVAALIHRLDVGQRYQRLLASKLDKNHADMPLRRERFMRQTPARLLLPVMEMKLEGELSQKAFDFIRCVVEMPDASARQTLHGHDIVVRPMTLVPRTDMTPDSVPGLFLIGPADTRQGPLVLHSLFNETLSFKEFVDQDDLMAQLRSPGPLQSLVLDRITPWQRKRYEHDGFIEAHIAWSTESSMDVPLRSTEKVSLGTQAIQGNLLFSLFDSTLEVLLQLARTQSVTSAQADWASLVHLMTLGGEQILTFLPGKLGALVALWQSQTLLSHSVNAAYEQRWGKALSEFSAALGMLLSSRQETQVSIEEEPVLPADPMPRFIWRNSMLPSAIKQRLRAFEVHDVELEKLPRDELLNLYKDLGTQRQYAAVAGQVYEVELQAGTWRIKGKDAPGPKIRLDHEQQWELDLEWGLRGEGGVQVDTQPISLASMIQKRVDEILFMQAPGMDAIRALSRDKARQIGTARQNALGYLQNSLFNLNVPFVAGLDAQVRDVLQNFFGSTALDNDLIHDLRGSISQLYMSLSDPSLSPFKSSRFVTGITRPGFEDVTAFVIKADVQQRIFLSELFFNTPTYFLKSGHDSGRAFRADDHFRAIALVHELSHQGSDTKDLAYLEASAPPLQLLDDSTPSTAAFKAELQYLREHALSHKTPQSHLFRVQDENNWRDLQPGDGMAYALVLKLTGQPTLDKARAAFMSDARIRGRIILSNADSVAMLVALLGRQRFT